MLCTIEFVQNIFVKISGKINARHQMAITRSSVVGHATPEGFVLDLKAFANDRGGVLGIRPRGACEYRRLARRERDNRKESVQKRGYPKAKSSSGSNHFVESG
jgi:hypothetical protein